MTSLFDTGCAGRDLPAHLAELPEWRRQLEQTLPHRSNTPRFLGADLVRRIARVAEELQRPLATVGETRQLLGLDLPPKDVTSSA